MWKVSSNFLSTVSVASSPLEKKHLTPPGMGGPPTASQLGKLLLEEWGSLTLFSCLWQQPIHCKPWWFCKGWPYRDVSSYRSTHLLRALHHPVATCCNPVATAFLHCCQTNTTLLWPWCHLLLTWCRHDADLLPQWLLWKNHKSSLSKKRKCHYPFCYTVDTCLPNCCHYK